MALKNYLVEGVSCSGKSSVARELKARGYAVVDGDNELAVQLNPSLHNSLKEDSTLGVGTAEQNHANHIWDIEKVEQRLQGDEVAIFFCGGSRNFRQFINHFDEVFVLDIDRATLLARLDAREAGDWGSSPDQRRLVLRLHETQEDVPDGGTLIDASVPLGEVVDAILTHVQPHQP